MKCTQIGSRHQIFQKQPIQTRRCDFNVSFSTRGINGRSVGNVNVILIPSNPYPFPSRIRTKRTLNMSPVRNFWEVPRPREIPRSV